MAQPTTTLLDELIAAARGSYALLLGNRQASTYFDFSQRGLVSSIIALLVAVTVWSFSGLLLGAPVPSGLPTQIVLINIVTFGLQAGVAWLLLRQMGRTDGFIPYLVATNWVAALTAVVFVLSSLLGPVGAVLLLAALIAGLVVVVNICRLIVTLKPMQIVIFLVLQAVGVTLGIALVGSFFIDPALLAAAQ